MKKDSKIFIWLTIFVVIIITAFLFYGLQREKRSAKEIDDALRVNLHIGMTYEQAESYMKRSRIEHSFDKSSKTIYAITRDLNGSNFLIKENLTFKIRFDETMRVAAIESKVVFTGP